MPVNDRPPKAVLLTQICGLIAVVFSSALAAVAASSWQVLRVGLPVFVGSDGADATYATFCHSVAAYNDWAYSGPGRSCWEIPSGTPAHVRAIVLNTEAMRQTGIRDYAVLVKPDSGAWEGYTSSRVEVQPRIPLGIVLTVTNDSHQPGFAETKLNSGQARDDGPTLANGTQVRVERFDAHTRDDNLVVRVLNGPHAGARGWMLYWNTFTE
jgi:hypothetical protein